MTGLRIGHGYDVHRLTEGRRLILGGVEVPYEKGLLGHSDADVLTHAVMDALLGAAALGDIGKLFPDTDAAYAGISSILLLELVAERLREAGYAVVNLDATVLAQAPTEKHIGVDQVLVDRIEIREEHLPPEIELRPKRGREVRHDRRIRC